MKPNPTFRPASTLLSNIVDIPVVGLNLVEDVLWVVPLIEHGLDLILLSFKPKPNRAFIGLSARTVADNTPKNILSLLPSPFLANFRLADLRE